MFCLCEVLSYVCLCEVCLSCVCLCEVLSVEMCLSHVLSVKTAPHTDRTLRCLSHVLSVSVRCCLCLSV